VDVAELFGEEFARRGHRIDWLLQSEQPIAEERVARWHDWRVFVGATDHGSSRLRRIRKHLLRMKNDLRMFDLVDRERYDFVLVKDTFVAAIMALVAGRSRRGGRACPLVYWLSWPFPEASIHAARVGTARYRYLYLLRGNVFKILLYKIILPRSELIFVQSAQMRDDLAREGVDPARMQVVPMGVAPVDEARIEPARLPPAALVYIGTLLKTRNLDILVRVLARVREQVPDAVLYMVGPEELPGDADVLRREAARLGIGDALVVTGRLERSAALGYVAGAAVCLSPFYPTPILNSTSPTKLVEYMALGRPVVANDHPEQRLVLAESGAGICVGWDEEEFAHACIALLEDPERCRAMGVRGRAWVAENRTYTAIADEVEARLLEFRAAHPG
jgi:glycosyltransferase involved in cell wall biosynthesis